MKTAEEVVTNLWRACHSSVSKASRYAEMVNIVTAFAEERVKEALMLGAFREIKEARAEALEEAAKVAEECYLESNRGTVVECGKEIAKVIRSWKHVKAAGK